MSSHQKKGNRLIVISALFLAITSIGISFATYERLSDKMSENHVISERFQKILQRSVIDNSETISFLSRRKVQPALAVEAEAANYRIIIKQINAQNKVITKILENHGSLQEEITRLKTRVSSSDNLAMDFNPDRLRGNNENDEILAKPITIEDLEEEIELANKQTDDLNRKTEAIFQSQTQDGHWAAQTSVEIQNVLEQIRSDQKFSDLSINNIDCRESVCKVELSHRDIQQLEEFDLMFLHEVSGDQPLTSTVFTKTLADGGIRNTYYLSTN